MRRRRLLTALGGVVGVGLAGCVSGDNGGSGVDDNLPDFSVDDDAQPTPMLLAIEPLGEVDFADHFTAEAVFANVGGADITAMEVEVGVNALDFGPIVSPSPIQPTIIELTDIESGDYEITEVDLRVNAAGTWEFTTDARMHPEVQSDFFVESLRLEQGDSFTSEVGGFEVTARDSEFHRGLLFDTEYSSYDGVGAVGPAEEELFVVHRLDVHATGDSSIGFGEMVFADNTFTNLRYNTSPTDPLRPDDIRDGSLYPIRLHGNPLSRNEIPAGETHELWVAQLIPDDEAIDARLEVNLWGSADTPDFIIDTVEEIPPMPAFEYVEHEVIDGDLEITVQNTGEAKGMFKGAVQYKDITSWLFLDEPITAELDEGETGIATTSLSRGGGFGRAGEYRILPFGIEFED